MLHRFLFVCRLFLFFFFNDTATTEIYPLSLHDALPILSRRIIEDLYSLKRRLGTMHHHVAPLVEPLSKLVGERIPQLDRKSTRLNSSHANISYAVFCLKKKINARKKEKLYGI